MNVLKPAPQQTGVQTVAVRFIVDVWTKEQVPQSEWLGRPWFPFSLSLSLLWQNEAIWIYRNKMNPQSGFVAGLYTARVEAHTHTHTPTERVVGSEYSVNFQHHGQSPSAGTLCLSVFPSSATLQFSFWTVDVATKDKKGLYWELRQKKNIERQIVLIKMNYFLLDNLGYKLKQKRNFCTFLLAVIYLTHQVKTSA